MFLRALVARARFIQWLVHHPRTSQPLHQQAPTTRFSNRASDYGKYRPSYPEGAIDLVFQGLGDPSRLTVADVGAGTGICARLLADRGAALVAVEPNQAMASAAEPHPRVRFVRGSAEETTIAPGSVDVIVCAQAFHWFRHGEALAEFSRILKPRGRLALIWNILEQADPATRAYRAAIRKAIGSEPPEMMDIDVEAMERRGFTRPRLDLVAHEQSLDRSGFIGRAMSASYVPKEGPDAEALRADLASAHQAHAGVGGDGLVRLRYQTYVYRASRS